MKKKLLALSLAACMALSLAACGSNPAIDPSDDGAGETTDAHPFTIGICHPGLQGRRGGSSRRGERHLERAERRR